VGCGEPKDRPETGEVPALPAVEQPDARVQQDVSPDQQKRTDPVGVIIEEAPVKPLDLSMPPQPALDPASIDRTEGQGGHLLPDLFRQAENPGAEPAVQVRGRVLMREGEEQRLDSFEGGQLILEKKTR
jgi:hypothetical protein